MNAASIILWVYVALLMAGGLMGFLKAKSKASLIASTLCAIPLAIVALGVTPIKAGYAFLFVIEVMFVVRFKKSGKFMPSGMMLLLTSIALSLLLVLRFGHLG
jgi:uncharacterized membrane protein (UPF0136 family)